MSGISRPIGLVPTSSKTTAPTRACVVTTSRADYSHLRWVMRALTSDPSFELVTIAGGTHFSNQHGYTIKEMEADGFSPNEVAEFTASTDSGLAASKSFGLAASTVAQSLSKLEPSVVILLGDRFEILAIAAAAMLLRIPIAHIAGGDLTEGALDDCVRHSLTKLAHLHFTTNAPAGEVIRQLGEDPQRIFVVGSPSLDGLRLQPLLERDVVEKSLGMAFSYEAPNVLVTFHPETRARLPVEAQIMELLEALRLLPADTRIIITSPNADPGYFPILRALQGFAASRPRATFHDSLGQDLYLSTTACVDVVVGNSSSGLYEVPSLKKPTVDIGERQSHRLAAPSVLRCAIDRKEIQQAVITALAMDCSSVVNPYGDGYASERIVNILREEITRGIELRKPFFRVN
jgi:UDP-hydrolysing UDP-N-acetyl-D-glucosamine 2-epimerase